MEREPTRESIARSTSRTPEAGGCASVKGEWVREDVLALIEGRPSRILSLGCGTCATEQRLQEERDERVRGLPTVQRVKGTLGTRVIARS